MIPIRRFLRINRYNNTLTAEFFWERIIRLEDGRVVYDGDAHAPEAVVQPNFMMAEPKAGEEGTQA